MLPTGAGKSHVAMLAIDDKRRSTLVVAPTLDLVRQWFDLLGATFGGPVGLLGGGDHDVQPLTVTTYDSAFLHMDHLGARFGLVVFDECHHLPGASYAMAARACLAPFRLGLTATPERSDGRDADLDELIGPIVYRKDIVELSGDYLAEYDTERVSIELSSDERAEHDAERAIYRAFVRSHGIRMSHPSGWSQFILLVVAERRRPPRDGRLPQAARARASRRGEARLPGPPAPPHRGDRAILFTQDNATAYAISRRFLVPVITHQTKVRERSAILAGLADGTYRAVATSKVLNEGVDIPDANVAVDPLGQRLGPRARAAPRAHPSQEGRQAGHALRARDGGDDRDVHERPAEGAQCLPLISSTRAGAAASCASSRSIRRARAGAGPRRGARRGGRSPRRAHARGPRGGDVRHRSAAARASPAGRAREAHRGPLRRSAPPETRIPKPCGAMCSHARARRAAALGGADRFDRAAVLAVVARERGTSPEAIERTLFADLRGSHVLVSFAKLPAHSLVELYENAQAQAVLLRAVRVRVDVQCASTHALRTLFRRLKFLRLLHTVSRHGEGHRIVIDGPFSLFESVTKYGLQLALVLPALEGCD